MYKWQVHDKQAYSVQQATSHSRGGTKREMQFQLQIYMITWLHGYTFTWLHDYMITQLHDYTDLLPIYVANICILCDITREIVVYP